MISIFPIPARGRHWCTGVLVGIVFSFIPIKLLGQPEPEQLALDPDLQISQYMLDTWQIDEGLPQNSVFAVTQTQDGYLWMATQDGLARFDGVKFTVFNRSDVPALRSNQIESMLEDRDGRLWIGTSGGGLSRMGEGSFRSYTADDGFTGDIVKALHEDSRGNLWIGTVESGLSRYNGTTFNRYTQSEGLASNTVLAITEDASDILWIGTAAGLQRMEDGQISTHEAFESTPVSALHLSADSTLWVGTSGRGLCRLSTSSSRETSERCYTAEDGLSGDFINTLLTDQSGTLWIGTKGGGLTRYYQGEFSTFTVEDGLPHDEVRALYQDRENNLWVGTHGGGISRLRGSKFATISTSTGLSHNEVYSVLEDGDGTVWIGTGGGGLNQMKNGEITTFTTTDRLPSNRVQALHEDRQGRLWVGLYEGGLCQFEPQALECYTQADGLSSNSVYSIQDDSEGNLWVGTELGVNRIHRNEITTYDSGGPMPHNWITAIHEDREGTLWIGTYGGLVKYTGDSFTTYTTADGLSSASILTLHEDDDGTLWIGTQAGGVCREANGRFTCYTTEDGLFSDDVLQILVDAHGTLWMGHFNGISTVGREQREAFDAGRGTTLESEIYNTRDGMGSRETNGGLQPPAWRSRDGRLWFATMKGVSVINPLRRRQNTVPPLVQIEQVFVGEKAVDLEESSELPPRSKNFDFRYTGLSFVSPEDVTFAYKLEGYDDHWFEAGDRRQSFYTNLPPGDYQFRVRAYNNDGVASAQEASVAFRVQPFFYQTTWFYLLCALAVVGVGAGIHRLRVRHLRTQQEKLEKLVDQQTEQLREQKQELQVLNADLEEEVQRKVDTIMAERARYEQELIEAKRQAEESARMKSNILMNMSHEVRTPLTSILSFVELLSQGIPEEDFEEFTKLIHRSGQRLLKTIDSVLEMSELQAGSATIDRENIDLEEEVRSASETYRSRAVEKNIDFQIENASSSTPVHLDPTALRRIVTNLVGNAVKFTDEGRITVRSFVSNGEAVIKVEDTGQGIDEQFLPELFEAFKQESSGDTRSHEGVGLGLAVSKHLVELMNGSITVDSQKGKGSQFTVRLPRSEPVDTSG